LRAKQSRGLVHMYEIAAVATLPRNDMGSLLFSEV